MDRNRFTVFVVVTEHHVALLAEGVDRNTMLSHHSSASSVALLAEGVDRNLIAAGKLGEDGVALLAEGVDRNNYDYGVGFDDACRPPRGGRG